MVRPLPMFDNWSAEEIWGADQRGRAVHRGASQWRLL